MILHWTTLQVSRPHSIQWLLWTPTLIFFSFPREISSNLVGGVSLVSESFLFLEISRGISDFLAGLWGLRVFIFLFSWNFAVSRFIREFLYVKSQRLSEIFLQFSRVFLPFLTDSRFFLRFSRRFSGFPVLSRRFSLFSSDFLEGSRVFLFFLADSRFFSHFL